MIRFETHDGFPCYVLPALAKALEPSAFPGCTFVLYDVVSGRGLTVKGNADEVAVRLWPESQTDWKGVADELALRAFLASEMDECYKPLVERYTKKRAPST